MRELEGGRKEVYDVDREKVKTLPRVCLIPPEGMSSSLLAIAGVFPSSPRSITNMKGNRSKLISRG